MAIKKSKKWKHGLLKLIEIIVSAIFAGAVFYGTIMLMFNILTPSSPIFMITLFSLGLIGTTSLALDKLHSTWLTRFFHYTPLSIALIILAIRIFTNLFPSHKPLIAFFIVGTAVFSHTLPIWNPKTTNLIRRELYSPKTQMGKYIFYVSIALIPIIGFVASLFTSLLNKTGNFPLVTNIIGSLSWFLALIAPYDYGPLHTSWEEDKDKGSI